MSFYYDNKNGVVHIDRIILTIVLVIAAIIVVFGSFTIVNTGHRGVLLTWGAYTGTLGEGLHLIIPIAQKVEMMEVRTLKYEVQASAATKDLLDVSTKVALNYHISPDVAGTVYQKIGVSYEERVIAPAVQESVKAVTAKFNANELITERVKVKEQIDSALTERLSTYDMLVETTSITDFQFPASFNQAILDSQTATKRALEAENNLKKVEFEAKQKIAAAEGEATAKLTVATAEAKAIELQGQALRNNPDVTQLRAIEKWNGVLPVTMFGASNNVVPFVNVPLGTQQ